VKNLAVKGTEIATLSIDVLRPGKAPERIGKFDARPPMGMVAKAVYQPAFQEHE
jgi:hypothetical protein